jgi:hypothetical protein
MKIIKTHGLNLRLADIVDDLADGVVYDEAPNQPPVTRNGKLILKHQQPPQRQQVERTDFGYPLGEGNAD